MIEFFIDSDKVIAVQTSVKQGNNDISKLKWLFTGAESSGKDNLEGTFIGPRREMITPWSTNAVEITQNMGISGILRIEIFQKTISTTPEFDPMLFEVYHGLNQDIFNINKQPEPIIEISDIKAYNAEQGLALSNEEINYLENLSKKLNRKLTDSEIFGFSQVNSEHCRHKIFNGTFVIDGEEKKSSLFQLIKLTTSINPNGVISAYKDNCAFLKGAVIQQFAPNTQNKPDFFSLRPIKSMISLKAETHNFPTTVEPFNGAATGTGGEIRDRLAGGKAAIPLAGTAVYMSAYPRLSSERPYVKNFKERNWLYQTPDQILIKASNGASDFGNKFGQPLTCGSLVTFEHFENGHSYGYDKVIMLAGGVGFGNQKHVDKETPTSGQKIVLLGGDNYRIGMGGGAVSSVNTGEFANKIELNAVQRSNPEMQKRVANAIRAFAETTDNPIISIHDHGAGGHLNCLSELVEETGGVIHIDKLPVGDPTLSAKEIIGNESQERMGLIIKVEDLPTLIEIAERERAPIYIIGETSNNMRFVFVDKDGSKPIDMQLEDMFGNPPKTIMNDKTIQHIFDTIDYDSSKIEQYIKQVLQLESVACKDWLTNKVDRSVTGRVAKQQTCGEIQLPLNNLSVTALDYSGNKGIAASIGHAPVAGIIDAKAGAVLSIAEALTNIVWAPLTDGIKSVSLSANWMWPCRNDGEDARLYNAVKAASDFAIALGINIPTGKDSLSMTQKYSNGQKVLSPGTVIISAAAEVSDITKVVEPVLQNNSSAHIVFIPFNGVTFELGGSAFAQVLNKMGNKVNSIANPKYFAKVFAILQKAINNGEIMAGHDISSGGLVTTLLEMCFTTENLGMEIDFTALGYNNLTRILFSEIPGVLVQVNSNAELFEDLRKKGLTYYKIGNSNITGKLNISNYNDTLLLNIANYRNDWFKTSYLLDEKQTKNNCAVTRYENYHKQKLIFKFPQGFAGTYQHYNLEKERTIKTGIKAAIIREKGVNGDREMAYSMYLAGMDVKDVHMTDLILGRETLEDIQMIVFVGGFSNSDVLGSAKGWAGAFLYNEKAKKALDNFYARPNTLSLGVCNGCQLMVELGLISGSTQKPVFMSRNNSGKFESAFVNVDVLESESVMLKNLTDSKLGVWIAHAEGKFNIANKNGYSIAMKYSQSQYPGNPNGSDENIAAICSTDGRHLAMMPHIERSIFKWNWPYYPTDRKNDELTPWIEAFVNARMWLQKNV